MLMFPRKRWRLFAVGLVFVSISVWQLLERGFDWFTVSGTAFFGLGALMALFQPRIEARKQRCLAERLRRLTDEGFAFGAMKGRRLPPFVEVQEVWLNTWPSVALVNGNELVLLAGLQRDAVLGVAVRHGIMVKRPLDIWELICEKFLDTEFDEEHKRLTTKRLAEAGIPGTELSAIRKKLRWRMLPWTFYSMEWIYCGHYDMLCNLWPFCTKTSWWSMEIALRGRDPSTAAL